LSCKSGAKGAKKVLTKQVGKITNPYSANWEFEISELLRQVPYADDYFILINELCTPKPRAQQTEPDLRRCRLFQRANLPRLTQITMPFGGKTLSHMAINARTFDFFQVMRQLLEAGTILLEKGVVHSDIHQENILIENRKAKLIDFGVAWQPDDLSLASVQSIQGGFHPSLFIQMSPEISHVFGIQQKMPENIVFAKLQDEHVTFFLRQQIFGISKESQGAEFRKFLRESRSMQEKNWYSLLKIYWSKQDAWAIGTQLLQIYKEISMDGAFAGLAENKKRGLVARSVMEGLTRPDPGQRLDCAEALEIYYPESKVLQLPKVKAWLQEQKSLRKELEKML
jgi:serine/threonine protein kinase